MERGYGSREGFLEEGDEQELGEELCMEIEGGDRWGISDYLLGWGRSGRRRCCSLGRRSRAIGRKPKGVDTALGGAPEGRIYLQGSPCLSVPLCLAVSSFGVLITCLTWSLSESDSLSESLTVSLCLSVSLSLTPFLGSGHLHEMSVRDKDTRKNPGWVGRKRGQGHRDS